MTGRLQIPEEVEFYRRDLETRLTGVAPFSSPEGQRRLRDCMDSGDAAAFFVLIEQLRTQDHPVRVAMSKRVNPGYCGLASLVMVLNALSIDPRRRWKGVWRWYTEEALECCVPLEQVRTQGITMDDFACLARCNGLHAKMQRSAGLPDPASLELSAAVRKDVVRNSADGSQNWHVRRLVRRLLRPAGEEPGEYDAVSEGWADTGSPMAPESDEERERANAALWRMAFPEEEVAAFRRVVQDAVRRTDRFTVLSYGRSAILQSGDGHFAPVAAYHAASDSVLCMESARFKFPQHWVPLRLLFLGLRTVDRACNKPRGFVHLTPMAVAPLLIFELEAEAPLSCCYAPDFTPSTSLPGPPLAAAPAPTTSSSSSSASSTAAPTPLLAADPTVVGGGLIMRSSSGANLLPRRKPRRRSGRRVREEDEEEDKRSSKERGEEDEEDEEAERGGEEEEEDEDGEEEEDDGEDDGRSRSSMGSGRSFLSGSTGSRCACPSAEVCGRAASSSQPSGARPKASPTIGGTRMPCSAGQLQRVMRGVADELAAEPDFQTDAPPRVVLEAFLRAYIRARMCAAHASPVVAPALFATRLLAHGTVRRIGAGHRELARSLLRELESTPVFAVLRDILDTGARSEADRPRSPTLSLSTSSGSAAVSGAAGAAGAPAKLPNSWKWFRKYDSDRSITGVSRAHMVATLVLVLGLIARRGDEIPWVAALAPLQPVVDETLRALPPLDSLVRNEVTLLAEQLTTFCCANYANIPPPQRAPTPSPAAPPTVPDPALAMDRPS